LKRCRNEQKHFVSRDFSPHDTISQLHAFVLLFSSSRNA